MKSMTKPILWYCLAISLLFIIPSVKFRLNNEKLNKSVVFAADFYEFRNQWELLFKKDIDNAKEQEPIGAFIQWLKKNHIQTVALKETTSEHSLNEYGFDPYIMDKLSSAGMDIILRPKGISHSQAYFENLNADISKYKIRYFLFDVGNPSFRQSDVYIMSKTVSQNHIIIFLAENINQTGPVETEGLDNLLVKTNYPVNRSYIIPESDLYNITGDNLTYRWLRAITDRNIRAIYIRPLNSPLISPEDNISNTFKSVSQLTLLLGQRGFKVNRDIYQIPPIHPDKAFDIAALFLNILFAVCLLLLYYGCNMHIRFQLLLILCFCTASIYLYLFTDYYTMFIAVAASIIYPSLTISMILAYLKEKTHHNLKLRLSISMMTILSISFAGALLITSSMSDIKYTMHLVNFNAAVLTYILPIVIFIAVYIKLFKSYDILRHVKSIKLSIKHIPMVIFCTLILYIYLSRSGNTSLIPASSIELEFRKLLERTLPVRPRAKEYLIGYPCLFFFIYTHYCKPHSRLLLPLGTGATITGISVINSFCHGFTPFITSVTRTISGFLLGILTTALVSAIVIIGKNISRWFPSNYSNSSSVRK